MPAPASDLLTDLLKNVSRSFYLTLRVLPRSIRRPIGLAYLLARASDTIADTDILPAAQRMEALEKFRHRATGVLNTTFSLGEFCGHQSTPAEKILLERIEEGWTLLARMPEADQRLVRTVLATITSGQILDVQRFGRANPEEIAALADNAELDDYTYRVAGCVGEFWTHVCRRHLFPNDAFDEADLIEKGIRFGKGLQLVNILRDIPKDLRIGRSYIPAAALAGAGLAPKDLLSMDSSAAFQPLFETYLNRAESHLNAGWEYTCALPFRQFRLRLACAWPILIGFKTLEKLRVSNVLNPSARVKITRSNVRSILIRSILASPFPARWNRLSPQRR